MTPSVLDEPVTAEPASPADGEPRTARRARLVRETVRVFAAQASPTTAEVTYSGECGGGTCSATYSCTATCQGSCGTGCSFWGGCFPTNTTACDS